MPLAPRILLGLGRQPLQGATSRWQWQPTLTEHDPNPPIIIGETPPDPNRRGQISWAELETPPFPPAILVDASVVRVSANVLIDTNITTAAFTPPNNSLLVACVNGDDADGSNVDVVVSDSGGHTWTQRVDRDGADNTGGHASIWTAPITTGASITVSVRRTVGDSGGAWLSIKVYVVTGANNSAPAGVTGEGSSTTNDINPNAYTSTVNKSQGFGCAVDWSAQGLPESTDEEDAATQSGKMSWLSLYKATNTVPVGSVVTTNFNAYGSGAANWNWVALEIVPATTTNRRGQVSWQELQVPTAPRRGLISWEEFQVGTAPRRGRVSWEELEVPLAPRRGRVSWAEFEAPLAPRRGRISWQELEVPPYDRRGFVSWTEVQVPTAPRRGFVSWEEVQVPFAPRRGLVSWQELQVPMGPRRGQISWAELQIPDVPRRGLVSWEELEAGTAPRRGRVSWQELEVSDPPVTDRRGRVSWEELQVALAPRRGLVSWQELEIPTAPRRGYVSWQELEVPLSPNRRGLVSWTEVEAPFAPRRGLISWTELQVPDLTGDRRGLISWTELEVPLADWALQHVRFIIGKDDERTSVEGLEDASIMFFCRDTQKLWFWDRYHWYLVA